MDIASQISGIVRMDDIWYYGPSENLKLKWKENNQLLRFLSFLGFTMYNDDVEYEYESLYLFASLHIYKSPKYIQHIRCKVADYLEDNKKILDAPFNEMKGLMTMGLSQFSEYTQHVRSGLIPVDLLQLGVLGKVFRLPIFVISLSYELPFGWQNEYCESTLPPLWIVHQDKYLYRRLAYKSIPSSNTINYEVDRHTFEECLRDLTKTIMESINNSSIKAYGEKRLLHVTNFLETHKYSTSRKVLCVGSSKYLFLELLLKDILYHHDISLPDSSTKPEYQIKQRDNQVSQENKDILNEIDSYVKNAHIDEHNLHQNLSNITSVRVVYSDRPFCKFIFHEEREVVNSYRSFISHLLGKELIYHPNTCSLEEVLMKIKRLILSLDPENIFSLEIHVPMHALKRSNEILFFNESCYYEAKAHNDLTRMIIASYDILFFVNNEEKNNIERFAMSIPHVLVSKIIEERLSSVKLLFVDKAFKGIIQPDERTSLIARFQNALLDRYRLCDETINIQGSPFLKYSLKTQVAAPTNRNLHLSLLHIKISSHDVKNVFAHFFHNLLKDRSTSDLIESSSYPLLNIIDNIIMLGSHETKHKELSDLFQMWKVQSQKLSEFVNYHKQFWIDNIFEIVSRELHKLLEKVFHLCKHLKIELVKSKMNIDTHAALLKTKILHTLHELYLKEAINFIDVSYGTIKRNILEYIRNNLYMEFANAVSSHFALHEDSILSYSVENEIKILISFIKSWLNIELKPSSEIIEQSLNTVHGPLESIYAKVIGGVPVYDTDIKDTIFEFFSNGSKMIEHYFIETIPSFVNTLCLNFDTLLSAFYLPEPVDLSNHLTTLELANVTDLKKQALNISLEYLSKSLFSELGSSIIDNQAFRNIRAIVLENFNDAEWNDTDDFTLIMTALSAGDPSTAVNTALKLINHSGWKKTRLSIRKRLEMISNNYASLEMAKTFIMKSHGIIDILEQMLRDYYEIELSPGICLKLIDSIRTYYRKNNLGQPSFAIPKSDWVFLIENIKDDLNEMLYRDMLLMLQMKFGFSPDDFVQASKVFVSEEDQSDSESSNSKSSKTESSSSVETIPDIKNAHIDLPQSTNGFKKNMKLPPLSSIDSVRYTNSMDMYDSSQQFVPSISTHMPFYTMLPMNRYHQPSHFIPQPYPPNDMKHLGEGNSSFKKREGNFETLEALMNLEKSSSPPVKPSRKRRKFVCSLKDLIRLKYLEIGESVTAFKQEGKVVKHGLAFKDDVYDTPSAFAARCLQEKSNLENPNSKVTSNYNGWDYVKYKDRKLGYWRTRCENEFPNGTVDIEFNGE